MNDLQLREDDCVNHLLQKLLFTQYNWIAHFVERTPDPLSSAFRYGFYQQDLLFLGHRRVGKGTAYAEQQGDQLSV
jgi:hypothetical protein